MTTGAKRGGPPTTHMLETGETFILDYSVIVQGYRSDFTNTLVVGGEPTAEQTAVVRPLRDGDGSGRAGIKGRGERARRSTTRSAGSSPPRRWRITSPRTPGTVSGIAHPEPPFIVRHSTETLVAGDVVTLEPGLYVDDIGIRIEHNYLITETGYERLSNHVISLT